MSTKEYGPAAAPAASRPVEVQFMRLPEVIKTTGISGSQIWRRSKAGTFPKPVKIGQNTTAWVASEVHAWAAERIALARSSSAATAASESR